MAKTAPGLLASFRYIDSAVDAIRGLKSKGYRNLTVYSAAPNHELEAAVGHKVSPVRLFTLLGGMTGITAGLAMTYWMSLDWPLLVGGKPIATVPPYVVIMFELMVLCGSLCTVSGVVILSAALRRKGAMYDPRFSDDRIGVFVPCPQQEYSAVENLLKSAGAEEIKHASS
jgi:Protein of unknown function (DUF3341)